MDKIKDKPLVSIIMPCYNHEKYVEQAIKSVIAQTYENIEFIVCDNGSTDKSYDIIKSYDDYIDKIIHLDKNDINLAGERLRAAARGEYIAFMTSDDVWESNKIEKQMNIITEKKDIKACFTWAYVGDEDLRNLSVSNIFNYKNRSRYEWLRVLLTECNHFAYPSVVIEKKAYFDALDELKAFYQLSDAYLWILILLKYEIYIIESPLVYFRMHPKGENSNMSTVDSKSVIRTENEHAIIIKETISQMDEKLFAKVFSEYLILDDVSGTNLICEKFFVLKKIAENKKSLRQQVIEYYYENAYFDSKKSDFIKILQKNYNYSYLDFQEYCADNGSAKCLLLEMQIENMQEYAEKQRMFVNALKFAIGKNELDKKIKKSYRKYILNTVSGETIEITKLMYTCVGKIISYLEENTIEKYREILSIIYDSYEAMEVLWNRFLSGDIDIDVLDTQWNKYKEYVEKEQICKEDFCTYILPYISNIYCVLDDYIN